MGCCVSNHRKMSKPKPAVGLIGSTGYVGKCLMPTFLEAVKTGKIRELRILTSSEKVNNDAVQSYVKSGAQVAPVSNYKDASCIAGALKGIDVFVSTLGTNGEDLEDIKSALLDGLVMANVKVYFPSEFGTNHYKITHKHPVFSGKQSHFKAAKEKGLCAIRMLTGDIMESTFGKWFGLDCNTGVWTIVGNGADIPCAMTSEIDLARFTLEAVLLAHFSPLRCPDELEVYSDMRTFREYAKAFDKVTGREIKINKVPLEEFMDEYNKEKQFEKLLMILFAEGAYDYSNSTGNDVLNPNESLWKLKKIEEYSQETNGVPWRDFSE